MRPGSFRLAVAAMAMPLIWVGTSRGQEPSETPPPTNAIARLGGLPLELAERDQLRAAILSHKYDEAEKLVAAKAERNPGSQSLLLVLADLLFLDSKHLNAVLVLKKAELLAPLDESSRYLLALAYVSIGRKNLAIPEFQELAKSNPDKAVYPYWLSRLLYRKGDMRQALLFAKQAIRADSSYARAYDQLGLCYAAVSQAEDAIRAYTTAIRVNEDQSIRDPWPALNLGTLYLRLDRLDDAAATLHRAIAVEGKLPLTHFRLGQVRERQGNERAAIQELNEAARLDPTYPGPHYALARIFRRQNDEQAAREQLAIFDKLKEEDRQKGITRPD